MAERLSPIHRPHKQIESDLLKQESGAEAADQSTCKYYRIQHRTRSDEILSTLLGFCFSKAGSMHGGRTIRKSHGSPQWENQNKHAVSSRKGPAIANTPQRS